MTKRKVKAIPEYRTREATRDMDFTPTTPLGSTRFEMRNQGPFRPDKTQQDYLPVQERPIGGILGFAIGWDSVWSWPIVGVSGCLLAWWHVEHMRGRTWEDELRRTMRR